MQVKRYRRFAAIAAGEHGQAPCGVEWRQKWIDAAPDAPPSITRKRRQDRAGNRAKRQGGCGCRRTVDEASQQISVRLDQARALIIGGPMPLSEVALTCGFSSQSHLTSVMRREDGMTPGALKA